MTLEGCASNDIIMINAMVATRGAELLFFTSSLLSHQHSSPLAAHFQEFSVSFLFFLYWICFPFLSALLSCWRLIAAEAKLQ